MSKDRHSFIRDFNLGQFEAIGTGLGLGRKVDPASRQAISVLQDRPGATLVAGEVSGARRDRSSSLTQRPSRGKRGLGRWLARHATDLSFVAVSFAVAFIGIKLIFYRSIRVEMIARAFQDLTITLQDFGPVFGLGLLCVLYIFYLVTLKTLTGKTMGDYFFS